MLVPVQHIEMGIIIYKPHAPVNKAHSQVSSQIPSSFKHTS